MSNRSYLYMSDTKEPYTSGIPERQIVAAANYVIPAFWFSAFEVSDVHEAAYSMEDEDTGEDAIVPIAVLRTTVDLARWRALSRRDLCFRMLPDSLRSVYDEWLTLLEGIDMPYLHLEASEIWELDPEAFRDSLVACTRAFEDGSADNWRILMAQASLDYDATTNQVFTQDLQAYDMPYLLRGGRWLRPVPWEE